MPRLSMVLGGPSLFVKRDDMTDLAFGGNKARKLEFLFSDAKDKGADVMIATLAVIFYSKSFRARLRHF